MSKYLKFDTPAQKNAGDLAGDFKLANHGLVYLEREFWNLLDSALYEESIFRGETKMMSGGSLVVHTGKWTARAANDKYIVNEPINTDKIDWENTIVL